MKFVSRIAFPSSLHTATLPERSIQMSTAAIQTLASLTYTPRTP